MWKCIFVRLIYSNFLLTTEPLLDVLSVRVHRELSASRLLVLSVLLQTVSKGFSQLIKTHYKYKSSISWFFCTFCLSACKSLSWMDELFMLFQNLHCDNDSWIYPKTKTFEHFLTPHRKPSYFNNLMQAFIFFVQIAIDFSPAFHFQDSYFYILCSPFIIHLNNFTLSVLAPKRFQVSFTSPSLIFPLSRFSVSVSASS